MNRNILRIILRFFANFAGCLEVTFIDSQGVPGLRIVQKLLLSSELLACANLDDVIVRENDL